MNNRQQIAAIDIGSNSIHLIIATLENNNLNVHYRARKSLKLREKINKNGIIDSDSIDLAVGVMDEFAKKSAEFNAKIIAVGTAFLRQANNSNVFLDRVFKKTGIMVSILTGEEEGKLIYEGVKQTITFDETNYLLIDIGGGSTEFIIANNEGVKFIESIDVGCISLTMQFFKNNNSFQNQINMSKNYINEELKPTIESINHFNIKSIIGTSGTINSIVSLLLKKALIFDKGNNSMTISCKSILDTLKLILTCNNSDELQNIPAIDKSRIEILPAGAVILNEILQKISCEYLHLSAYSIKEGIIFNYKQSII